MVLAIRFHLSNEKRKTSGRKKGEGKGGTKEEKEIKQE